MEVIRFDKRKFDTNGIHEITGTKYDTRGYDMYGYNAKGIHMDTGTPYNIYGYDRNGFNKEGYNTWGYDRNGYNKEGYDVNGIDVFGMKKATGQKDPRIVLAESFIMSGLTLEEFAKEINRSPSAINNVFQTIRKSPCISEKLDEAIEKSIVETSKETIEVKKQLLSGEINIRDVGCIDDIIRACSEKEKQEVREILIRGVNEHNIKVLEYKKIFGIKEEGKELPQRIIDRINPLLRVVKKSQKPDIRILSRSVYQEMARLESYKSPYKDSDLTRVGYTDKKGKERWLEISPKRIEMAKKYLQSNGEFICYKTMNDVFMGIVRGTLKEHEMELKLNQKDEEPEI